MNGYKGFHKGMVCSGYCIDENFDKVSYCKQYTENTMYEEPEAEICKNGMHFCKRPIDVLLFYHLFDRKTGEPNEFCPVEALGKIEERGGIKFCTDKLKIGEKMSYSEMIDVIAKDMFSDSVNKSVSEEMADVAFCTDIRSISNSQKLYSVSANTKSHSLSKTNSINSVAVNTGCCCISICEGENSASVATDTCSASICRGRYSISVCLDEHDISVTEKDYSIAVTNDNDSISVCNGEDSLAISTGRGSASLVTKPNSIAIATGVKNKVRGVLGSYIALAEWGIDEKRFVYLKDFKTHKVDGEIIKPNVFYTLKDGEFVEVNGEGE